MFRITLKLCNYSTKTFSYQKKAVNLHPFCKKVDKIISNFDIAIHGLEDKTHEYDFEGSDSFFKAFEQDYIENGNFKAHVSLEKTSLLLRLKFNIVASIHMQCDRSFESFTEHFNLEKKYIYKFGDKPEVLSDEMEVIPHGVTKINVSQHIFDFISLQIPMKKLHPKFRNEVGGNEEGIMVYSDSSKKTEVENESIDPRWADLLKLKDFKN